MAKFKFGFRALLNRDEFMHAGKCPGGLEPLLSNFLFIYTFLFLYVHICDVFGKWQSIIIHKDSRRQHVRKQRANKSQQSPIEGEGHNC